MTEDEAAMRMVASTERHRFACLRVVKNNYGPTGAEMWLERTAGGALRVAELPTMGAPVQSGGAAGAMPPIPAAGGTRARVRQGARAAAMHAHSVQMLQYLAHNADDITGGAELSERQIGTDLWGAEASLSTHGIRDRARRVIDFCESQAWLQIERPSEEERQRGHKPCTYIITPEGKAQYDN